MSNKNKDVLKSFQEMFKGRVIGAPSDTRLQQQADINKLLGRKKKKK